MAMLLLIVAMASCSKNNEASPEAALEEFTIDGSASSAYFTVPNNTHPSPENDNARAFISLADKRSYNRAQALTDQSRMDIVLGTTYYQQPGTPGAQPNGSVGLVLSSTASGDAWEANTNGHTMDDFTTRKAFYMARTQKNYADVSTRADLDAAFAETTDDDFQQNDALINRYGNQVLTNTLLFKTQEGKRGIMKLNSYDANKPFLYDIAFKMEM